MRYHEQFEYENILQSWRTRNYEYDMEYCKETCNNGRHAIACQIDIELGRIPDRFKEEVK